MEVLRNPSYRDWSDEEERDASRYCHLKGASQKKFARLQAFMKTTRYSKGIHDYHENHCKMTLQVTAALFLKHAQGRKHNCSYLLSYFKKRKLQDSKKILDSGIQAHWSVGNAFREFQYMNLTLTSRF